MKGLWASQFLPRQFLGLHMSTEKRVYSISSGSHKPSAIVSLHVENFRRLSDFVSPSPPVRKLQTNSEWSSWVALRALVLGTV